MRGNRYIAWLVVLTLLGTSRSFASGGTPTTPPPPALKLTPMLSTVPQAISGTLSPFTIAIDGEIVVSEKFKIAELRLNGSPLQADGTPSRSFFARSEADILEFAYFQIQGGPEQMKTVEPARIERTVSGVNALGFQVSPEVAHFAVDQVPVPVSDDKHRAIWRYTPDLAEKKSFLLELKNKSGATLRAYNLFFYDNSITPPKLVSPRNDSTVRATEGGIAFKWKKVAGVKYYRLEIKKDAQTIRKLVRGEETRVTGLEPGSVFWNVSPIVARRQLASERASPQVLRDQVSDVWSFELEPGIPRKSAPLMNSAAVDLAVGLQGGSFYVFPNAQLRAALKPRLVLGIQALYANQQGATGSLRTFGVFLTYDYYFLRNFSGPEMEAGVGAYFFNAKNLTQEDPMQTSPAGFVGVGWQWHPLRSSWGAGGLLGAQYIAKPTLTTVKSDLNGFLPFLRLSLVYTFD